ncbi:MAG TPA: hypothetical protein VNS79_13160 [Sphingobium sp.]|nr:hypothetical protein [Sphingobium sp.]
MFRTLIVGAAAAIIGVKLKRAYDAGKLDPYIDRAKAAARDIGQGDTTPRRPSAAPAASDKARPSPPDNSSRPARAAPWPVDTRAMPAN